MVVAEQSDGGKRYGGFWRRVPAAIIDFIVVITPVIYVLATAGPDNPLVTQYEEMVDGETSTVRSPSGIGILCMLVFWWIYEALLTCSTWRATLGKKVMGLVVVDLYEERLSLGRSTTRHITKFYLSSIFAIGFLMVAFSKKKQGLNDGLAGTLVFKKASLDAE